MKTCSLACCNKHKQDTQCNGQRDRTKYINKEEFTDLDLLSDYRFLEEQAQLVDTSHRSLSSLEATTLKSTSGFFENLRKFLYSEFNICLRLMPAQSTRHLNNKTKFTRATRMVSWSTELLFDAKHLNKPINLHTKHILFSSQDSLRNVLGNFYDKYKHDLFDAGSPNKLVSNQIELYNSFNDTFESKLKDLNVLFRIDDYERQEKYFIQFNLDDKLEDLLKDKTIIEYPTLYLVKSECLDKYVIKKEEKDELNILTKSLQIDPEAAAAVKAKDLEDGECEDDDDDDENDLNSNKRLKS